MLLLRRRLPLTQWGSFWAASINSLINIRCCSCLNFDQVYVIVEGQFRFDNWFESFQSSHDNVMIDMNRPSLHSIKETAASLSQTRWLLKFLSVSGAIFMREILNEKHRARHSMDMNRISRCQVYFRNRWISFFTSFLYEGARYCAV